MPVRYTIFRNALFFLVASAASSPGQSPDITQLKNKLTDLEKMMQEIRQQIAAVEQSQNTPAHTVVTPPPKPEVPTPLVPTEHIGDLTRTREVASDNPESAARIDNEPMNRALRGYFRLPGTGTLIKVNGFVKTDIFVDTNQAGTYYGAYVPSSFPSSDQPHTQNSTVSMRPSRFAIEIRQPVHTGSGTSKDTSSTTFSVATTVIPCGCASSTLNTRTFSPDKRGVHSATPTHFPIPWSLKVRRG